MIATAATMMPWRQALPKPIDVTAAASEVQVGYHSSGQQQMSTAPAAALRNHAPPTFSSAALQDLSLALGVMNLGLVRLVLDHVVLGNQGLASLSLGLARCHSLKHFSACHCGIGPPGIKQFASALTSSGSSSSSSSSSNSSSGNVGVAGGGPDLRCMRQSASMAAVSRLSLTSSSNPTSQSSSPRLATVCLELEELHFSGNPLNGRGLQYLNPVLHGMASLKVGAGTATPHVVMWQ
jgi:hypothetical protein